MSSSFVKATNDEENILLVNISRMDIKISNCILNIIIQKSNRDINILDTASGSGSNSTITIKYDNINFITAIYKAIYNLYNTKIYDITTTYKMRSCFDNYIYLISAYYAYNKMIEEYNVYTNSISFNNYIDIY